MGINTIILVIIGIVIVVDRIIAYQKYRVAFLNRIATSGSMITGF